MVLTRWIVTGAEKQFWGVKSRNLPFPLHQFLPISSHLSFDWSSHSGAHDVLAVFLAWSSHFFGSHSLNSHWFLVRGRWRCQAERWRGPQVSLMQQFLRIGNFIYLFIFSKKNFKASSLLFYLSWKCHYWSDYEILVYIHFSHLQLWR